MDSSDMFLTEKNLLDCPDETELISMRKALDMDAELGVRLERLRQEEAKQVF